MVTGTKKAPGGFVPDGESELAKQVVDALPAPLHIRGQYEMFVAGLAIALPKAEGILQCLAVVQLCACRNGQCPGNLRSTDTHGLKSMRASKCTTS